LLAKPIVLRMMCSIAAEPNRRNFRVWNGHGYVTTSTLPMAIPDTEISADRQTDRRHYCDNTVADH